MPTPAHHRNGRQTERYNATTAILALGFRIQQTREYAFHDAQREFGLSLRTYRRYLTVLRASGMILDAPQQRRTVGLIRYLGYDQLFCTGAKNVA